MFDFNYIREGAFQSTLPAWGATIQTLIFVGVSSISIHAPRVGSDLPRAIKKSPAPNFNPRSPRGERHTMDGKNEKQLRFQSTLPAWGATRYPHTDVTVFRDFNPRSPRGERLKNTANGYKVCLFQSTLPAWGATVRCTVRLYIAFSEALSANRIFPRERIGYFRSFLSWALVVRAHKIRGASASYPALAPIWMTLV